MRDPVVQSMVASGLLDAIVLFVFTLRLWVRIRMQRVGWEDIWATVAFFFGVLNAIGDWIYLVQTSVDRSPVFAMWIYMFTFTCLLWSVRISIIFSIIRIIPANERLHTYGLVINTFFLLTCCAFIAQKAIFCSYVYHTFQSAPSSPFFRCNSIRFMGIIEVGAGSIADLIAVVFPLYVLRRVTLPPKHLRLLRLVFSSTILVSIMCAIGVAFRVVPALAHWSIIITNFQIATCLIVCNLLVVVTYLYRVLASQKHRMADVTIEEGKTVENNDLSTPSSISQQMTLTTVELFLFSTQGGECVSVVTDRTGSCDSDERVMLS